MRAAALLILLGVATIAYLPYCFFNILSPLMTILVAALGWKIKKAQLPQVEGVEQKS